MAKKISAPLERTARLLDLVPYISSHQGISLKELAQTFKVDQGQMTSDLTTLWMCGLPGYTPLELMDLDFESGFVTIHNVNSELYGNAIATTLKQKFKVNETAFVISDINYNVIQIKKNLESYSATKKL